MVKKLPPKYPAGIWSHDPQLQFPRCQAETIPLDQAARARKVFNHIGNAGWVILKKQQQQQNKMDKYR
jgi:hypothetical protein